MQEWAAQFSQGDLAIALSLLGIFLATGSIAFQFIEVRRGSEKLRVFFELVEEPADGRQGVQVRVVNERSAPVTVSAVGFTAGAARHNLWDYHRSERLEQGVMTYGGDWLHCLDEHLPPGFSDVIDGAYALTALGREYVSAIPADVRNALERNGYSVQRR